MVLICFILIISWYYNWQKNIIVLQPLGMVLIGLALMIIFSYCNYTTASLLLQGNRCGFCQCTYNPCHRYKNSPPFLSSLHLFFNIILYITSIFAEDKCRRSKSCFCFPCTFLCVSSSSFVISVLFVFPDERTASNIWLKGSDVWIGFVVEL